MIFCSVSPVTYNPRQPNATSGLSNKPNQNRSLSTPLSTSI